MSLTASEARHAKPKEKDYKLSDEKGLFLLVKKNGSKYWRMKYRTKGKEKMLALGVFPEVTLAKARIERDRARELIRDNIDPSQLRQATKQIQKDMAANSFEVIAREWLIKRGKKSDSGDKRLVRMLEKDLFPTLGHLSMSEITPPQCSQIKHPNQRRWVPSLLPAKARFGNLVLSGLVTKVTCNHIACIRLHF